jgi:hypothetical protein
MLYNNNNNSSGTHTLDIYIYIGAK